MNLELELDHEMFGCILRANFAYGGRKLLNIIHFFSNVMEYASGCKYRYSMIEHETNFPFKHSPSKELLIVRLLTTDDLL